MSGERIKRDDVMGRDVAPDPDEPVLATLAADRRRYWRDAAVLAALAALGVGAVLAAIGNPHVLVGAAGGAAAIGLRAAFLASEALGQRWRLTPRRLIGPGGQIVPLVGIAAVRRLMGDVQVVTVGGDKHLIRHQADPAATVAAIRRAAAAAGGRA